MYFCYKCLKEVNIEIRPTRSDLCEYCNTPLRSCLNCKFYDETAQNFCREPNAGFIFDKESGNFCGYWVFADRDIEKHKKHETKEDIKKSFDSLFKKS